MSGRPSTSDAEIFRATRAVLERHGYAEATADRIADEAGVSRVTLHRRGLSKDALLGRLVEQATADYREALAPAVASADTAAVRLTVALNVLCTEAERNLTLLLALRAQADSVFHEPKGELTRSVFTEPLEEILRAGDGTLQDVADPSETATVLFNLVGQTYLHLRTGHGFSAERARRSVTDIALFGVLA